MKYLIGSSFLLFIQNSHSLTVLRGGGRSGGNRGCAGLVDDDYGKASAHLQVGGY